jgi:hypothetical protein
LLPTPSPITIGSTPAVPGAPGGAAHHQGDDPLDRYDAWSKFEASPESCVNLFALDQSNTRKWLA